MQAIVKIVDDDGNVSKEHVLFPKDIKYGELHKTYYFAFAYSVFNNEVSAADLLSNNLGCSKEEAMKALKKAMGIKKED
jgi:hypothetical protein